MRSMEARQSSAIYDFALAFADGNHHDGDGVLVDAIHEPVTERFQLDLEASRHTVKPGGFDVRIDQTRAQALLELFADGRVEAPPLFERGWQELEFIDLQA